MPRWGMQMYDCDGNQESMVRQAADLETGQIL
jgi:hypothetical protein